MTLQRRVVRGYDNAVLTLADLPKQDSKVNWTIKHKTNVLAAVRGGLITVQNARDWYGITIDELLDWQRGSGRHGPRALRATKLQCYR